MSKPVKAWTLNELGNRAQSDQFEICACAQLTCLSRPKFDGVIILEYFPFSFVAVLGWDFFETFLTFSRFICLVLGGRSM